MNTIGIICEYNPFHNGHLYHINKIKELYPNHTIICVLGGEFMQRGEISVLNKCDKTDIALNYGIDLVIELPFIFASQSADLFAKGAIQILKTLKVDKLVFGSESNDINNLINLAKNQINNNQYNKLVKKYMDEGVNYPTASNKALKDMNNKAIDTPNDILGLAYIKQIIIQKADIKPITIKRINDYHDLNLKDRITSASSIRKALKKGKNIKKYIPKLTYQYLNKIELPNEEKYFQLLKYKILSDNNLSQYQTVDEGIENRIKKYILSSNNIDELIERIKTKRYTHNKINRMLAHILVGFTKEEAKSNNIKYIRILGFNKKGQKYLNSIKKEIEVPIITNYSNIKDNLLDIDERANNIYSLLFKKNNIKNNKPIKKE
ncbi:MAG: nucleotidyltransferase [Bacilli bacterium]